MRGLRRCGKEIRASGDAGVRPTPLNGARSILNPRPNRNVDNEANL
jgi:hypothetical protein